jgi:putative tryptophan/tyrosine transport system substrate-binding protein
MRRRQVVALLTGVAAWPSPAASERSGAPAIGFLSSRSPEESAKLVEAFVSGLREGGFVDGRDLRVAYRWARGHLDDLPALAAELVREPVAVLVAAGGSTSALAAKSVTSSIPIVFVIGGDPVKLGIVSSLARPGGNATGITIISADLAPKRLAMLRELAPDATGFAILTNPDTPEGNVQASDAIAAAERLGIKLSTLSAPDESAIEAAFAKLSMQRVDAVLLGSDPVFDVHRDKVVKLAAALGRPVIYQFRDYAAAGGLMSYGPDISDAYRRAGLYAGQILKGAAPDDLPVLQPTKFELVINLKTARSIGLTIPLTIQAQADEVIE